MTDRDSEALVYYVGTREQSVILLQPNPLTPFTGVTGGHSNLCQVEGQCRT